ncbi:MAG: peptidoglycan D,D-transpeptidase FtsI family protein [Sphingomonas sp.]
MSVHLAQPVAHRRESDGRPTMAALAPVRLMMLLLMLSAGVFLVILRLGALAIFSQPATSRNAAAALVPLRADIVDRNGAPLARTIDAWSVGIHPNRLVNRPEDLAPKLATLLPEHDTNYYLQMLKSGARFAYLRRRALPELVRDLNALGEPAMDYAREPERLYPQSGLAAHVLGFLDYDGRGVRGMERKLDARLIDESTRSAPIALSLDSRAQAAMESELGAAMVSFQAKSAAGVMLDVRTGEVIAMASFPNFDPNRVPRIRDAADFDDPAARMLRNNVTQSIYELGSTFKPITMAAAIDTGIVTSMAKRFDARAPLQVGRFKIRDDHPQKRWLDVPETLVHSSNIVTARIADQMGGARMQVMFRKLGFDTQPDIEIPEKARTIWPAFWSRATVMTTGYGHGIAVTPLHLASAYAALVNGGIWRPATLLKVAPGHAGDGRRVLAQSTSDRMRQLLRLVVLQGTGKKGEAPGYRVGGKTGTAEIATKSGYSHKRNVSTFAAAFPMDAPRYVVVAMLDSPTGNAQSAGQTTAGWTVAPVVSRVIMRTGAMLGVRPDMRRDVDVSELLPLLWHAPGENAAEPE